MKLPGYNGPDPPEEMRDIIAWENALAAMMDRVVFVDEDGKVVDDVL